MNFRSIWREKAMIDKMILEEVEDFVRLTLTEKFKDEFKFGPNVAVPKTD